MAPVLLAVGAWCGVGVATGRSEGFKTGRLYGPIRATSVLTKSQQPRAMSKKYKKDKWRKFEGVKQKGARQSRAWRSPVVWFNKFLKQNVGKIQKVMGSCA